MSSMADSISGATEARRTAKDREGEESKREKGKERESARKSEGKWGENLQGFRERERGWKRLLTEF